MKQTKKYTTANEILTYPHSTQEQLYQELNRLGWWWDSKKQLWERSQELAEPLTDLIRVRVWADGEKVWDYAGDLIDALDSLGLKLLERSDAYPCRPPKQAESRVYLTFLEK